MIRGPPALLRASAPPRESKRPRHPHHRPASRAPTGSSRPVLSLRLRSVFDGAKEDALDRAIGIRDVCEPERRADAHEPHFRPVRYFSTANDEPVALNFGPAHEYGRPPSLADPQFQAALLNREAADGTAQGRQVPRGAWDNEEIVHEGMSLRRQLQDFTSFVPSTAQSRHGEQDDQRRSRKPQLG